MSANAFGYVPAARRWLRNEPAFARDRSAFTLIELLVVIGIMIILMSLMVPAVTGLSKSNGLSNGGRLVSNLLAVARSEAINRRALVRFQVATTWPGDPSSAYRKITLVQHDAATATDTQLTGWETLPVGITFNPTDPGTASGKYFFTLNQVQAPKLKFGGQDVDTTYIEFLPTGALNVALQSSPVRIRLVPGVVSSGQLTVTGPNNWFDTTVDALVGRVAVSRP